MTANPDDRPSQHRQDHQLVHAGAPYYRKTRVGCPSNHSAQAVRCRSKYAAAAHAITSSPPNQATESQAADPIPAPMSSPRVVSMMGVTGWCSAKPRSTTGIVAGGTKALET